MIGRRRLEAGAAAISAAAAVLLSSWTSADWAAVPGPSYAGPTGPVATGTSFVPSIAADTAWTDNINLAPPGHEQSGELTDVAPGVSLTHDSVPEHLEFDYTLHALVYSGGHDFLHGGHLLSTTRVIPDWFELDLAGTREQGQANPGLPADLTYLFPTSNLGNYTVGLVKPTVKHTFSAFQAQASYTRGISDFGQASSGSGGSYRSNLQGADASVGSIDKDARVTWDASYHRNEVQYESPYTLHYLFEQTTANLGVLTIPTLRILGRGGKESEPTPTGLFDGGLDSTFWAAGFDRSTGPDDDFRFLVGHRFFGRTYEGSWRKDSRLLKLDVRYIEQPNTQEGALAGQSLAAPPLVTIPGTYGFTQLQPGVFLDKSLTGAATLTGRVTQIGLGLASEQQQFYNVATPGLTIIPRNRTFVLVERPTVATETRYENRTETATLYARRELGPLSALNVSASLGNTHLEGFENGAYKTQRYSAAFTRRLGQWTSAYLRADHVRQYGDLAEYTVNIVSLGITASLGKPPQSSNGTGSGVGRMYGP